MASSVDMAPLVSSCVSSKVCSIQKGLDALAVDAG